MSHTDKNQRGVSIFLAVIIMTVLLATVLGLNVLIVGQIKTAQDAGFSVNAFYAADAGNERALYGVRKGGGGNFPLDFCWESFYCYHVESVACGLKTCLRSAGIYKDIKRAIEASFVSSGGGGGGGEEENLYEYYNSGDDSTGGWAQGVNWLAQTFTPVTGHTATKVKLLLWRDGLPGILTIGIKPTDGSGHPTSTDLCGGTTDGDSLTAVTTGEWREISLGAGCVLSAGIKYAIVIRALGASGANYVYNRRDISSPSYSGGNYERSTNSGSSWSSTLSYDLMFEEWGRP